MRRLQNQEIRELLEESFLKQLLVISWLHEASEKDLAREAEEARQAAAKLRNDIIEEGEKEAVKDKELAAEAARSGSDAGKLESPIWRLVTIRRGRRDW